MVPTVTRISNQLTCVNHLSTPTLTVIVFGYQLFECEITKIIGFSKQHSCSTLSNGLPKQICLHLNNKLSINIFLPYYKINPIDGSS